MTESRTPEVAWTLLVVVTLLVMHLDGGAPVLPLTLATAITGLELGFIGWARRRRWPR